MHFIPSVFRPAFVRFLFWPSRVLEFGVLLPIQGIHFSEFLAIFSLILLKLVRFDILGMHQT
jgi:hypothetical protein